MSRAINRRSWKSNLRVFRAHKENQTDLSFFQRRNTAKFRREIIKIYGFYFIFFSVFVRTISYSGKRLLLSYFYFFVSTTKRRRRSCVQQQVLHDCSANHIITHPRKKERKKTKKTARKSVAENRQQRRRRRLRSRVRLPRRSVVLGTARSRQIHNRYSRWTRWFAPVDAAIPLCKCRLRTMRETGGRRSGKRLFERRTRRRFYGAAAGRP